MLFTPVSMMKGALAQAQLLLDLDFREPPQQAFPTSATGVLSGFTATEIFLFDEASGNAVGEIASTALTPTNSPTQGEPAVGLYNGTDMYSLPRAKAKEGSAQHFLAGSSSVFDQTTDSFAFLVVAKVAPVTSPTKYCRFAEKLNTNGINFGMINGRVWFTVSDGTSASGYTGNTDYDDGCWHAYLGVVDRTAEQITIYTDRGDSTVSGGLSAVTGSLTNSGTFLALGRSTNSSSECQFGYLALFEGSQVESMDQTDLDTFWTHGTHATATYSRASLATTEVGVEAGFGVRVAKWGNDQLPYAVNTAFSHASNVGLSDYDSKTNLVTYSEQLDDAAWTATNITVTADNGEAPDGTLTADLLTADANNGYMESAAYTVSVNDDTVASCYIRRSGGSDVTGRIIVYDVTGAAEESAQAFTATSVWQRIKVSHSNASSTSQSVRIEIDTSGEAVEVWGVDAKIGSIETFGVLTPYIPTTSASATMAHANCYVTDPTGDTYIDSEIGEMSCVAVFEETFVHTSFSFSALGTGSDDERYIQPLGTDIVQFHIADSSGTEICKMWNLGDTMSVDTEYEHRARWDNSGGLTDGVYVDAFEDADRMYTGGDVRTGDNETTWTGGTNIDTLQVGGIASGSHINGIIARARIWDSPRGDTP